MGGIPPGLQQAIMQMMMKQGAQQPSQIPGGGGGMPQGVPQGGPPQATPQMPQFGGQGSMQGSGRATPNIPGISESAMPQRQSGRSSASGVAQIPFAAMAIKQKIHSNAVQKYRALANDWLAQQQNPDSQKSMQQAAQNDPNIAKALEKKQKEFTKMSDEAMKDPNSAAAQGIQAAYQDQRSKDAQQQEAQMNQAKLQEQQARAESERALAYFRTKMGDTRGEVTPEDQYKASQQNWRMSQQIASRSQQLTQRLTAQSNENKLRLDQMKQIAEMKESGLNKRSSQRQAQSQAAMTLYHQAQALDVQYRSLVTEHSNLQTNLSSHAAMNWVTGEGDDLQAKLAENEAKQQELSQKLQSVYSSFDQMQAAGVIAQPQSDIPTPMSSGATDRPKSGPVIHDMTQ